MNVKDKYIDINVLLLIESILSVKELNQRYLEPDTIKVINDVKKFLEEYE